MGASTPTPPRCRIDREYKRLWSPIKTSCSSGKRHERRKQESHRRVVCQKKHTALAVVSITESISKELLGNLCCFFFRKWFTAEDWTVSHFDLLDENILPLLIDMLAQIPNLYNHRSNTKLTRFVARGRWVLLAMHRLYLKTSNQVNLVLVNFKRTSARFLFHI